MVQTILTPTDGSDNSNRAITQAVELGELYGATIHAVAVMEKSPHRDRLRYDPEANANETIEEAREIVEAAGLEFTGEVREGIPAEEILEYISEHDIDMIVMGTHGRTGLDRLLIGSVAEKTIRQSSIPVLMVPPESKEGV